MPSYDKLRGRDVHEFSYTAQEIYDAAEAMRAYHLQRMLWWQAELEEAEKKLRETLQLREYAVSGLKGQDSGLRVDAVFDENAQSRVQECRQKANYHSTQAEEFQLEAAAYGHVPSGNTFDLTLDDVKHFKLGLSPTSEPDPALASGEPTA